MPLPAAAGGLYRVAVEFIEDVADAGTRYVEVTFTPGGHGR
jgi:hypothetical protein